jgi:thioredoxin 1
MKLLINILFTVLILSSCNSIGQKQDNISPADFEKGIGSADAQLIDVRSEDEFTERHIKGAKNMNINSEDFATNMSTLDKNKPVYFYCLSGKRSRSALEWARENGFTKAYNLEGGIMNWANSGKAVEESANATGKGLTQDDYLKAITKEKLVLVDFNAVWCGPCKVMKPRVEKVLKTHAAKLEVLEIDVDKNPAIANMMNISGIPLLILYKQGKEVWRNMGTIDEKELSGVVAKF